LVFGCNVAVFFVFFNDRTVRFHKYVNFLINELIDGMF